MIKHIPKRTNKNYEIQHYYPETSCRAGDYSYVTQCDTIEELALCLANMSWSSLRPSKGYNNPTIWYNGEHFEEKLIV